MDINQLITPDRVKCLGGIKSKKRALESLGQLLSTGATEVDPTEIFHHLVERERLGSTGLGHGVALPHARLAFQVATSDGLRESSLGCFIKLNEGVDFDSPDSLPADLLFALLVPENCTDEHLQILASLAGMFSNPQFCEKLRHCNSDEELFALLSDWTHSHQAAS